MTTILRLALTFMFGVSMLVTARYIIIFVQNHDTALHTRANCIAATAKAEGYKGNVHGEEAWALFADNCR